MSLDVAGAIAEELGLPPGAGSSARRRTMLASIAEQGKLTPALEARILAARGKTEVEDLCLPCKPKRRTRAAIARERGLEPLADAIWAQAAAPPAVPTERFVAPDRGVPDVSAAWQGARDIVAERIAEDADVRAALRELALAQGTVTSRVVAGKENEARKYADYFDRREPVKAIPSHRTLALRRGESEGLLRVWIDVDRERSLALVRRRVVVRPRAALAAELELALVDAYDRLLEPSIASDVRALLKDRADAETIRVFAENLRHLLLAAPLGAGRRERER